MTTVHFGGGSRAVVRAKFAAVADAHVDALVRQMAARWLLEGEDEADIASFITQLRGALAQWRTDALARFDEILDEVKIA
jgi:hypothetical protein